MPRVSPTVLQQAADPLSRARAVPPTAVEPQAGSDNCEGEHDEHNNSPKTPLTLKTETLDHASDGEEAEDSDVCMESILKQAARTTGVRLTWILYSMIFLVIALFTMILVQTTYTMNAALRTSGRGSVQTLASSLLTNAQLLQHDLDKMFSIVDLTVEYNKDSESASAISVGDNDSSFDPVIVDTIYVSTLCDRLFGSPEYIVNNDKHKSLYTMSCNASEAAIINAEKIPRSFPSETIRTASLSDTFLVSYRRSAYGDDSSVTGVVLNKQLIGRNLLSNDMLEYSTGTLEHVYVGILLGTWNSTEPTIVLHSLGDGVTTYTTPQPTVKGAELEALYQEVCAPGSKYIWHTVARSDDINYKEAKVSYSSSTKNDIPKPYEVFGGTWQLLSRSVLCMAICTHPTDTTCAEGNPTTMRYIIDYTPYSMVGEAVNIVSIISILALVLFSLLAIASYFSITIPINYLRFQLLHVSTSTCEYSNFYKNIIRLSHPVWLGELVALVRTFNILRLCYQLNIKYVPEHVLKRQARELYNSRSKLNAIYKLDLDDHLLNSADESDDDERAIEIDGIAGPRIMDEVPWSPNRECEMNDTYKFPLPTSPIPHNNTVSFLDALDESINVTNASLLRDEANAEQSINPAGYLASVRRGCKPPMTVRNVDDATIMCLYLQGVDDAFVVNYALAVKQHRRLMKFMLHFIRRHNGTILQRSGEYFIVAWNAFGNCSAHAEKAAICAIELAAALSPHRSNGLDVGIFLHKGTFVCGIVEDSKEAFTTAFGSAPRQAYTLSQLVSTLPYFHVVVSEPVKQALASNYEFNIVDIIRPSSVSHQLILFELQGRKARNKPSMFVPSYTNAFQHFRNHDFAKTLEGIGVIRKEFPGVGEALLQ
ncbi:protein kinase, partial [Strigomonas culicis]